jgi:hypothetical protein
MAPASAICSQPVSGVLSFKMTDLIGFGCIEVEAPVHSFPANFELKSDKILLSS